MQKHNNEDKPIYPEALIRFIDQLQKLNRGELARLRRNAGNCIAESRQCAGIFYRILSPEIMASREEELYFLVATLYGLNKYSFQGDFGKTLKGVQAVTKSKNLDRRVTILLDSQFDVIDGFRIGCGEVAYRLRQLVRLAEGHQIGVDWTRLLYDLTKWNAPEKWVQKQWARSYFGEIKFENQNNETKREAL
ncbi:MAG: type I-E CRISPR-associated protein Cse2/CasB [Bacillota bacterium]